MMGEGRKALFFDIDGTILSEKTHQIPESAIRAIRTAREAGHLTFINTGRTRASIPSEIKAVGFDGILCGCGTEIIYHNESIMHQGLDPQYCRELAEAVIRADVGAILEGDVFYLAVPDRPRYQFLKKGGDLNDGTMTMIFQWKPEEVYFDKFVFWEDEYSRTEELFSLIRTQMDVMVRAPGFYEMAPKGYTKAKSIQIIQEMFQIRLEDCYVFGDSSNDLTMFEYCPNAIAMKEHDPVLDAHTSYVTDAVEEDGIWNALVHLGLINPVTDRLDRNRKCEVVLQERSTEDDTGYRTSCLPQ